MQDKHTFERLSLPLLNFTARSAFNLSISASKKSSSRNYKAMSRKPYQLSKKPDESVSEAVALN